MFVTDIFGSARDPIFMSMRQWHVISNYSFFFFLSDISNYSSSLLFGVNSYRGSSFIFQFCFNFLREQQSYLIGIRTMIVLDNRYADMTACGHSPFTLIEMCYLN